MDSSAAWFLACGDVFLNLGSCHFHNSGYDLTFTGSIFEDEVWTKTFTLSLSLKWLSNRSKFSLNIFTAISMLVRNLCLRHLDECSILCWAQALQQEMTSWWNKRTFKEAWNNFPVQSRRYLRENVSLQPTVKRIGEEGVIAMWLLLLQCEFFPPLRIFPST